MAEDIGINAVIAAHQIALECAILRDGDALAFGIGTFLTLGDAQ